MLRAIAGIMCIALTALSVAGQTNPSTAPAEKVPEQDLRLEVVRKAVEESIAVFDKEFANPQFRYEARQFSLYAHYVLALGQDVAKAEAALGRLFKLQDMDAQSPRFGEFAAAEGMAPAAPGERGTGAVTEFTVLPLVQIALRYGEKLSPAMQTQVNESLAAALSAIRRHRIDVDLSSIYLQQAVSMLLIGEALRDKHAIAEAQAKLTEFLSIARSRGIEEYTAPNFAVLQLSSLLIAQNYTLQPEARRLLDPLVKFVWSQVAASVVPRRGTMGGPHSREMDFVHGLGGIDVYLFLEGMRNIIPLMPPFSEGLRAYLNHIEGGWRPDDEVRALATMSERVVKVRWGAGPGRDRYHYLTDTYSIGSASATAATNDRKLVFEFASSKPLPAIWVVPDIFDAPYGRVKGRSGQPLPPSHLFEQIAAVQEKNVMLALMNLSPQLRGNTVPQVATNVVFPAAAEEVILDGKRIDTSKSFEMNANLDATLVVRDARAAVAIRLFDVDGIASQQPVMRIKFDGNSMGVARLVAYQYRAPAGAARPLDGTPVRVGVVFIAAAVQNSAEFAEFQKRAGESLAKLDRSYDGRVWRAKLVEGETTLEAALDVTSGNIVSRRVNGQEYQSATFKVNGRDLAGDILGW